MRMLDLFCGRLGWSKAFLARGWEVTAVDLVEPSNRDEMEEQFGEYGIGAGRFGFQCSDVLDLIWQAGAIWDKKRGVCLCYGPDFICASSPCEQFSTMRNFRPPVPHPEMGIKLFNHTRDICEASGVPYVMENVAGAGKHVGKAVNHCGSYYLWGSGVPPILPQGIHKGMTELAMGLREHKGKPGWDNRHGKLGQTPTTLVATIPPELANCVCDYAERLCEGKS